MHPILENALGSMGIGDRVPTLRQAAEFSEELISAFREFLQQRVPPEESPLDVVAVGSIARREASAGSDLDYLIIAHGLPTRATSPKALVLAIEELRKKHKLGSPGTTGMFGKVIAGPDLTERIGLQEDTNLTHSRRILLLEESVSLYQPARHEQLLTLMLDRYLADYATPKRGVPRFLLNDVIRYWRTIAVDYQAKRWEDREQDWGLRYFKLVLSRKLAFAGTLASLFLCEEATAEYLLAQFEMPPLARLAQVHERLEEPHAKDALREVFLAAERFAEKLGDEEFRPAAKAVRERADIESRPELRALRELADGLQSALECVFFGSRLLGDVSRKYLSF